eukprot:3625273-Alexandrium_andersonii.AAC.1
MHILHNGTWRCPVFASTRARGYRERMSARSTSTGELQRCRDDGSAGAAHTHTQAHTRMWLELQVGLCMEAGGWGLEAGDASG